MLAGCICGHDGRGGEDQDRRCRACDPHAVDAHPAQRVLLLVDAQKLAYRGRRPDAHVPRVRVPGTLLRLRLRERLRHPGSVRVDHALVVLQTIVDVN